MKAKKLSIKQHEQIGFNLKGIQDYLYEIHNMIAAETTNKSGHRQKILRRTRNASNYIHSVRSQLEDMLCCENPESFDHRVTKIYWGRSPGDRLQIQLDPTQPENTEQPE